MSLSILAYDDTYPGLPVRQPVERTIAYMSGNFARSGAGRSTAAIPLPDGAVSLMIASEASSRDGAASILDRTVLATLAAEIGEEVMDRALCTFFEETNDRFRLFRRLSCQADREAIGFEAHSLKGPAGTFGLVRAVKASRGATITARDYASALDRLDAANASSRAQFPAMIAARSTLRGR
jgi:HPt (histidine-containing phosphotransfer) domain-containing protein